AAYLRTLDLYDNPLTASGARVLARSPHLAALERLRLERCRLRQRGGQYVLDSQVLTSLRRLSLRHNALAANHGVRVGPALARTLEHLDLSLNDLDDRWAARFVDGPPMALQSLALRSSSITIAGVLALVEARALAAVDALSVSAQKV